MIPYERQLRDYNFDKEFTITKKKGKLATKIYSNTILTFDIEVSSAWINENGKIIRYRKGRTSDYWNSLTPLALPYLWQFSCDGTVYYGRELWDFEQVLKDIPKDLNCIIWVHNLNYEFMFLSNFLEWDSVFARAPHKPIKAVAKKYSNIEFRCSYMLTRLSLDSWGKQLGVPKAVGFLNYEKIRTPLTPLTEKEMFYGEQDCKVLHAGIVYYLEKYGKLRDIPLTQTGTVRKVVKERLSQVPGYISKLKKLVPKDAKEYSMLKAIFAGGYTHANRWYAGELIKGDIRHFDFASSYPTVMIAEKFPISPWLYTAEHAIPPDSRFEDFAYIIHIKFNQLNCTTFNTYIQASKSIIKNGKYDNGRVLSADSLEIWITEQDWITIRNTYEWEDMQVLHLYESKKEYLPKEFVEYILELYENKTSLKNLPDKSDLYLQSKQYINSLFGMMVTAIIQAVVELSGDDWKVQPITEKLVNEKLESLKKPNPRDTRYFLSYSWGCWVTAYARRNLWKCIEKNDDITLYGDTDSLFLLGECDFTWYNEEITDKLKKACEYHGIDFGRTRPKTIKGVEKPLGVFEEEAPCIEFCTLGAKRYVERRKDGRLYLTVSGINKQAVGLLKNDIRNFKDGFIFDKDSNSVTKRLGTYICDMPEITWPDGYRSKYTHGINIRRNGYKLGITDEYKQLIDYYDMDCEDLPESFRISMRGRFTSERS